jgi:hypothetical protein
MLRRPKHSKIEVLAPKEEEVIIMIELLLVSDIFLTCAVRHIPIL